ncbi:MAG: hypothetical protein AB8H79_03715, partial [Myxococcota bacterium]
TLEETAYPVVMTAYAGSLWLIETDKLFTDDQYNGLSEEYILHQRSCTGASIATWPLTDEDFSLHAPQLVPIGGTMLVLGTHVLTGDYPAGEISVRAFDVDTAEPVYEGVLDLPNTARFSALLDADVHDDALVVATRHLTPDQERLAIVQIPDLLDAEATTTLVNYRIEDGVNINVGNLAMTDSGPTLAWYADWWSGEAYLARNGGPVEALDGDFWVHVASAGDQDWMLYGPTIENLNTGETMALPDRYGGFFPTSEGPIVLIRASGDEGDELHRYDAALNLTETVPVDSPPNGLIDLGEGMVLLWRSVRDDDGTSTESFETLQSGGQ